MDSSDCFFGALIALQILAALAFIAGCLIVDYRRKKVETRTSRAHERHQRHRRLGDAYRNGSACGELLGCMVCGWLILAVLWAVTTGVFAL